MPVVDADPAAVPATIGLDLRAACEERAVVRLTLADGQVLTGSYTSRVGLHFLHRTGRDLPLIGEITGPYGNDSKAGQLRHRRCLQCDAYARMVEVLRHDRRGVQADLFHPLTWPRPP